MRLWAETKKDVVLTKIMEQVARGFPDSARKVHPAVRPYHRYREQLSILDDVLCYKTRVVVPTSLRQNVLTTLHSAHQGTVGMTSRAAEAVFWHDMSADIQKMRNMCKACTRNAPSQPAGPPVRPPSPAYPLQLMVGDYFSRGGHNFLVVADRYSGWFSIYKTGTGEYDAEALTQNLRQHFITFGVPEEYASDDGPQFKAHKFANLLKTWGVYHRQSSAYFPHSNSRAELAVKTAKRCITENVDSMGNLNQDTEPDGNIQCLTTVAARPARS